MNDAPVQQPKKKTPVWVWVVGSIFGYLVLISVFGGGGEATKEDKAKAVAAQVPPLETTALELVKDYEANEAAAQQKYGGKILNVSGVINSIELDIGDDPYLVLRGKDEYSGAHAALDDANKPKAAQLSKGQKVVVTCQSVSEIGGTPMLKDCAVN
ncbi:MAG: hypothetical protein RLZZ444_1233 [Pseudomonadota bacterium]|jgi:uncharacterized protein (DUF1330 family)